MSRRRERSEFDNILDLLKSAPIWVGPILAAVSFVLLRYVAPQFVGSSKSATDTAALWQPAFAMMSWFVGGGVLFAWVLAEAWKWENRRLLDSQTGLESIRNISWREFENLVSEAYRRKGYLAEALGNDSGDGGVDIRLKGHGETVLVQCKQWKAYKVGVSTIRELLGVVTSEKANSGIVVTSGKFTQEAMTFARQNPMIELVDGLQLAELIKGFQAASSIPSQPTTITDPATPVCPICSSPMALRIARKGQNAGSQFWGCSMYPKCKGTRKSGVVQPT